MGGIPLHKALAVGVGQKPALAPRAFGDQAARAVDTGRVKLHKFHILQGQSRPRHHAAAIAGAGMRRGGAEIGAAVAAGRQNNHLGVEHMDRTIVQLPRHHTGAAALGHDQVDGEVFDEEFSVVLQALAIKRVQNGMAGAVSRRAGALHGRAFAVFGGVAAKGALVDLALFGARKGHAVVFQLVHGLGCFARKVFHRIGIAQPIRPFDRVIHMPLPRIRPHIAQ